MKNLIFISTTLLGLIILSIFLFQSFSKKNEGLKPETKSKIVYQAESEEKSEISPDQTTKTNRAISPVYPVEIPVSLNFSGENVPIDIFYVHEYLDRELTINTYYHSSTMLLLKRAHRWLPIIEPILAKNNIPNDFKYLAMIESNLENVVSPAGATGFWQFLKHTAREYGLEVNSEIDERYNIEKSTIAACNYLKEAYTKYHNWTLVAAAYNAGSSRITRELQQQKVKSYYELLLNQETARYIFRILAIKTIFENPKKYGFHFDDTDLYPPIPTQKIQVTKTIKNLVDFVQDYNINYKTLKYFNPWLRKDYLPNRSKRIYYIKVPVEGNISYPL